MKTQLFSQQAYIELVADAKKHLTHENQELGSLFDNIR
jgi:hypothetical protein